MIGVISHKEQKWMVEEFFELFKTPWEHWRGDGNYDVVITTDADAPVPAANLTIAFFPKETDFDRRNDIRVFRRENGGDIAWGGSGVPLYGEMVSFPELHNPFLSLQCGETVGREIDVQGRRVFRIGYDLFEEIGHLLRHGQPVDKARVPTLELHISMLRKWILDSGNPLFEIPPAPYGYDFITCLTHDIDFMGIRDHRFDHTMFGFAYRSLIPKYLKGLDRKSAGARYRKNLRALLSLPLVHMGLLPDFWYPLDRYLEAEREKKSTFFFVPFKDRPGATRGGSPSRYRATRYDLGLYKEPIRSLARRGCEVGLHGIDAWRDFRKGREELESIRGITGERKIGVRMHWLYFSARTPKYLEEAGVYYDSTLGYNETVGFRSGTTQVFRLPGTSGVFELPLHVQDTAMLFPGRMGISESRAFALCEKLVGDIGEHGGVFTINWHDRSLAPERNWDILYLALLGLLQGKRTWFATAGEAVGWFEMRRSIRFVPSRIAGGVPEVRMGPAGPANGPPAALRAHRPAGPWRDEGSIPGRFTEYPLSFGEERAVGC